MIAACYDPFPMRAYNFLTAHFALKCLYEKRLKISTIQDLNDPFELIPYNLSDPGLRKAMNQSRDRLASSRGLLCFSADWHDPVIWAHYGDKHRGMCLGFELPEDMAKSIEYVTERLLFPTASPLSNDYAETMLFTKYTSWKYEQEIRMWAILEEEEDGLYFKDFDDTLRLVEVIVGARCTVPKTALVRALVPLTTEINLIKARAGFTKFEIVTDQLGLK
jgi:hypothetical protein